MTCLLSYRSSTYLLIDSSDDSRLDVHSKGHTYMEQLVEEEGIHHRAHKEQCCVQVTFPLLHSWILCIPNQEAETRDTYSKKHQSGGCNKIQQQKEPKLKKKKKILTTRENTVDRRRIYTAFCFHVLSQISALQQKEQNVSWDI